MEKIRTKSDDKMYNLGLGHTQVISDICFESAEKDYVFDIEGKRYVDFNGTLNLPLGHETELISSVLKKKYPLNAVSYATVPKYELCKKLSKLFPEYTAFQFYSAGTEANEGAMRYAMAITGKDGFGAFRTNYHGRTRATVSLCNMKPYNGKRLAEYFRISFPYDSAPNQIVKEVRKTQKDVLKELEALLCTDYKYNCAGFFYEPIQGKAVNIPPVQFYKKVQEICNAHQVLMIADEYLTSMRCGSYSLSKELGIEPDIMTVGKCLGNGVPFAVLMCHKKYTEKVWEVKGSTTFGGNPVSCATVLKNIEYIEKNHLMERVVNVIEKNFIEIMSDLIEIKEIAKISAKGGLLGIEFDNKETCINIAKSCLEEGILVSCINKNIRITPSFVIDEKLLKNSLIRIKEIIIKYSMEKENG